MIDPRQQKGAKLLSHPFPNPRLTGFLRDLVGVMGRKTIIKSVSFRKYVQLCKIFIILTGQEVSFNTRLVIVQAA